MNGLNLFLNSNYYFLTSNFKFLNRLVVAWYQWLHKETGLEQLCELYPQFSTSFSDSLQKCPAGSEECVFSVRWFVLIIGVVAVTVSQFMFPYGISLWYNIIEICWLAKQLREKRLPWLRSATPKNTNGKIYQKVYGSCD